MVRSRSPSSSQPVAQHLPGGEERLLALDLALLAERDAGAITQEHLAALDHIPTLLDPAAVTAKSSSSATPPLRV
jgi:hypothetical protein